MNDSDIGASPFRVAQWEIDPASNRMRLGRKEVRVEPKVMAVLVYLANRPDRVVSRTQLEADVWTGMVVSYDAVTGAIQKLRRVFDDDPAAPRFIETISKKGYRLVAPVTACDSPRQTPADIVAKQSERPVRRLTRRQLVLAGTALVLCAGVLLLIGYRTVFMPAERVLDAAAPRTLAVLPFDNLTGDTAQDYFAEGMSDDLIASLTRFGDLTVIARDSSARYRHKSIGLSELAQRLNVRYVLRGSVQREASRLRITAHLADAYSGETLWGDSFDDDTSHLFEMQDRIIRHIVTALTGRINVRDRQELSRPQTQNMQAYDLFLYGRERFFRYANAQENRQARESFRQAIALDPAFPMAYAMLAWTHAFDAMNGWSDSRRQSLASALDFAGKAIDLNSSLPVAYFVRGLAYRELGEWTRALAAAEKAIELDPNYASGHVLLATLLYFDGRADKAVLLLRKAIALNPHHPFNYSFHLAQAYYILGRYDAAIATLSRILETNPGAERVHVWLAAALAQAGRTDEARWETDQVLTADPDFNLQRAREIYPFRHDVDMDHLISGLRKAGFSS